MFAKYVKSIARVIFPKTFYYALARRWILPVRIHQIGVGFLKSKGEKCKQISKVEILVNAGRCRSQFYQDYFLDSFIFMRKKHGFFLDVGANDPVRNNNTYFFEKDRNWTGLAFEPIVKLQSKWKKERAVQCLPIVLGEQNGEASFTEYLDDSLSGISENVIRSPESLNNKVAKTYAVKMYRLADILVKENISHVDLLSLDVEGGELAVLEGINFDKCEIDYILLENNKGTKKEEALRQFLKDKGYTLLVKLFSDEIWKK